MKAQSNNEGFQEIINIKVCMKKGLYIIPLARCIENVQNIPQPSRVSGFVDAEVCFYLAVKKIKHSLGFQAIISFSLSQHTRDEILFHKISEYLNCGSVRLFRTRKN